MILIPLQDDGRLHSDRLRAVLRDNLPANPLRNQVVLAVDAGVAARLHGEKSSALPALYQILQEDYGLRADAAHSVLQYLCDLFGVPFWEVTPVASTPLSVGIGVGHSQTLAQTFRQESALWDKSFLWVPPLISASAFEHHVGSGFWISRSTVTVFEFHRIVGEPKSQDTFPKTFLTSAMVRRFLNCANVAVQDYQVQLPTLRQWVHVVSHMSSKQTIRRPKDPPTLSSATLQSSTSDPIPGLILPFGNVWELVFDEASKSYCGVGGSWRTPTLHVENRLRFSVRPDGQQDIQQDDVGFRLILTPK